MVDFLYKPSSNTQPAGKTEVKPEVKPKTEVKPNAKLSNWDEQIAPVLDENPELKKVFNYSTSKHIMRAVNGRYDKQMHELKTDDPKAYALFKKFKDNSWALANELKKKDFGNKQSIDLINKYTDNANAYFDDIQKSFSEDKKRAYVMNDKAQLLTAKDYEKYKQDPEVSKEASNTAKVIKEGIEDLVADYETPNVSKAYQKLKGQDSYFRDKGVNLISPITKSWTATTLQRLGEKGTDADTNNDGFDLINDSLKHIGKYKTTLDPQLSKKDQADANSILKQLNGKNNEQKYKILKDNAKVINGMVGRMGYYGNAKVFNQYRNSSIGKDTDFYPAGKTRGKSQMDYFNMSQQNNVIDTHINNFRNFREGDSKVRLDALGKIKYDYQNVKDAFGYTDLNKKQTGAAFDALVDEQGHIRSFDAWMKQLGNEFTTTTVLKDQWGYEQKFSENTEGLSKFYNAISGSTDPDYFVSDYNTRGNLYSQSLGDQKQLRGDMAKDRERQSSANAKQRQVFMEAYKNFKKAYKKSFDMVNVKNVYDSTLMDIGFGDERNQALEYKGVNLSVNKDLRLKETSGPKQENVNKIFNLMIDANGEVDIENIALFDNAKVKQGLNAINEDDLDDAKKLNEKTLKDFLQDKNEHINVTFLRNTNVPGQSAYKFYNPETKKSMVLVAPQSMLGNKGIKEDLYTKTGRDPLDFTFQLKGELTMPTVRNDEGKPAYISAALKYDKTEDAYYGLTEIYNSQGKKTFHRYEIPMGSAISVSAAQKNYMDFLTKYRNRF
jgi:hypothetical protein